MLAITWLLVGVLCWVQRGFMFVLCGFDVGFIWVLHLGSSLGLGVYLGFIWVFFGSYSGSIFGFEVGF